MERKHKIGTISAGLGAASFVLGGWPAAILAAGVGYFIGDKTFPEGGRPWNEVEKLLSAGESERLEFKKTVSASKGAGNKRRHNFEKIAHTVAAFANSDGGELVVGVADDGRVAGISGLIEDFSSEDKLKLAVYAALDSRLDAPLDRICRLKIDELAGEKLLRIEVSKSPRNIFTRQEGDLYVRQGNRTVKQSAKQSIDRTLHH